MFRVSLNDFSPGNPDWEEADEDSTSSENGAETDFSNNRNANDISMKDISVIDENSLRLLDDIYDQVRFIQIYTDFD